MDTMTTVTPSSSLLLTVALLCSSGTLSAQETRPAGKAATAAPSQGQQDPPTPAPVRPPGGAPPSKDAFRMGSPAGLAQGTTEEQMWPAATAEGWLKPCLVRWQRTFDDAVRVARARHQPILVAVNMDGEIASEHYAGVRYREPETAALMDGYACVIASVYRHTPRDYDEEGRRVECPRFGRVTCGEHIENERELYEKYFDGMRVSPRHIVLDLEGQETHDVFYSWDTATVFTTFKSGREGWPEPLGSPEPTIPNLVKSADVEHRRTVERRYVEGDREARRAILEAVLEEHVVDQVEVLRTAIFGLDIDLAGLARRALAQCETEGSLDLMAEALKVPLDGNERQLLLDAVARIAKTSPRARTLAALHNGLTLESRHIDARSAELAAEYAANSGRYVVDAPSRAEAAASRPKEPGALLDLAEALIALGQESTEREHADLFYEDARATAREAEQLGAKGPRLDAAVALAAGGLRDLETARKRAVAAIEGGLLGPRDDASVEGALGAGTLSTTSRTRLLLLFAGARRRAIRDAYRAGDAWPPEWLSDVIAAHRDVADDPLVDSGVLADHYDFLRWIGAAPRALEVLDNALVRFPDSAILHERLRERLLWEAGPAELERWYADALTRETASGGAPTQLTWFAGYASLIAAEHHRRRSEFDTAVEAYGRAIAHYQRNVELFPDGRDNCLHFIALSHAGQARLALERGELDSAAGELLTAFQVRPDSAATPDGLNITPIQTALMIKARLLDAGNEERAAGVQAGLDALDPKLLAPSPTELQGSGRRGPRNRPPRNEDPGQPATGGGR
jgi:tetratricopeptide (TPR) repeat protein